MTEEERQKKLELRRVWYSQNKEKILQKCRERRQDPEKLATLRKRSLDYYHNHKERAAEIQRAARAANPEVFANRRKRYVETNKDKVNAAVRAWRAKSKDHRAAYSLKYRAENKDRMRATRVKRAHIEREQAKLAMREKRKDPVFRAKSNMRSRMWHLLKESKTGTVGHIRFSGPALRAHLEPQFKPGMTWENYGSVWHVDHIKPCALFDFTNPVEVEACFALSNLQPLWAEENKSKGDRYPYQSAA